jgi:hypothetical protein
MPKVGPFRGIQFKPPTQETTRLFMASFNATMTEYRRLLHDVGEGRLSLPNRDFDTGKLTAPAEYPLADDTYSKLLRTLAEKHFSSATPEVKQDILTFFQDPGAPIATKRNRRAWQSTLQALSELKQSAAAEAEPLAR